MDQSIPAWLDGQLRPVDKVEVHRRGLKHQAVSVFVMSSGQTLLQRRADGKYHTPGLWANACCTHPHWGEPMHDCAVRRLREELGIRNLEIVPRGNVEYRAPVGRSLVEHEVVSIFTADAPPGLLLDPDTDEVAELRWIGVGELGREIEVRPAAFTPWLRIYLADHAGQIFGEAA